MISRLEYCKAGTLFGTTDARVRSLFSLHVPQPCDWIPPWDELEFGRQPAHGRFCATTMLCVCCLLYVRPHALFVAAGAWPMTRNSQPCGRRIEIRSGSSPMQVFSAHCYGRLMLAVAASRACPAILLHHHHPRAPARSSPTAPLSVVSLVIPVVPVDARALGDHTT